MTGRKFLVALIALTAVVACSSPEPPAKAPVPPSTSRAIALLDHVQADPIQPGAVVVDVLRLRSLLTDTVTDLDVAVRGSDQAAKHFAELVQVGLPQLQTLDEWPAGKTLDLRAITGIASNGASGKEQVTVIATSQPFEEIAKAFVAAGYKREGSLLRAGPQARTPTSSFIVAGGPGLLVLAYSVNVAQDALAGTHGITGPMRELATWVNAPVVTISGEPAPACLDAVAYTDDVVDHRERIVVVTQSPSADRVRGPFPGAKPLVEGGHLTLAGTYDDEHSAANLVTMASGMPDSTDLYDCG